MAEFKFYSLLLYAKHTHTYADPRLRYTSACDAARHGRSSLRTHACSICQLPPTPSLIFKLFIL